MHEYVDLGSQATKVLDCGCGPGKCQDRKSSLNVIMITLLTGEVGLCVGNSDILKRNLDHGKDTLLHPFSFLYVKVYAKPGFLCLLGCSHRLPKLSIDGH